MLVYQEWKELWSPFLYWLLALVKCWEQTKSRVSALNRVWARDKNVLPSDLHKYQRFVPNFRRLLPSPSKRRGVPDVEHMTTYTCCRWPLNFSPYKRWLLLKLNLVYGNSWTNIYAHRNNRAWCKATGSRYATLCTWRKQGTHGAAGIDNQLDKCFYLLLELLSFGWIDTAALWAKGKQVLTCTQ